MNYFLHLPQVEGLIFDPDTGETGWRSGFGMPHWIGLTLHHDYPANRVSFKLVANNRGDFMAPGLWAFQVKRKRESASESSKRNSLVC